MDHVMSHSNHLMSHSNHMISHCDHVMSYSDHMILHCDHVMSYSGHEISHCDHVMSLSDHVMPLSDYVILHFDHISSLGMDLTFGRWDTWEHHLTDVGVSPLGPFDNPLIPGSKRGSSFSLAGGMPQSRSLLALVKNCIHFTTTIIFYITLYSLHH